MQGCTFPLFLKDQLHIWYGSVLPDTWAPCRLLLLGNVVPGVPSVSEGSPTSHGQSSEVNQVAAARASQTPWEPRLMKGSACHQAEVKLQGQLGWSMWTERWPVVLLGHL